MTNVLNNDGNAKEIAMAAVGATLVAAGALGPMVLDITMPSYAAAREVQAPDRGFSIDQTKPLGEVISPAKSVYVDGDSNAVGLEAFGNLAGTLQESNGAERVYFSVGCARAVAHTVNSTCGPENIPNLPSALDQVNEPQNQEAIQNSETAIFLIGSNFDNNFGEHIREHYKRVRDINPTVHALYVNLYSAGNGAEKYTAMNEELEQAGEELGFTVVDWATYAKQAGAYAPGEEHPSDFTIMSSFISETLGPLSEPTPPETTTTTTTPPAQETTTTTTTPETSTPPTTIDPQILEGANAVLVTAREVVASAGEGAKQTAHTASGHAKIITGIREANPDLPADKLRKLEQAAIDVWEAVALLPPEEQREVLEYWHLVGKQALSTPPESPQAPQPPETTTTTTTTTPPTPTTTTTIPTTTTTTAPPPTTQAPQSTEAANPNAIFEKYGWGDLKPEQVKVLSMLSPQFHETMAQKPATIEEAIEKYDWYKTGNKGPLITLRDVGLVAYAGGFQDRDSLAVMVALGGYVEGGSAPFVVNTSLSKPGKVQIAVGLPQMFAAPGMNTGDREPYSNLDPLISMKHAHNLFSWAQGAKSDGFQPWEAYTKKMHLRVVDASTGKTALDKGYEIADEILNGLKG